jgi:hypothetical protein
VGGVPIKEHMATYKVIADNVSGKKPGDTITDEELIGCSVEALILGGHIEANKTSKPTKEAEAE